VIILGHVLRLAIGLVGLGNMRIVEFTNIPELKDVDLLDDLQFYMENDPNFYRKILFPVISKMKSLMKTSKQCPATIFRNAVDKAALLYCKKFNIPDNPKSVFTDVDRDAVARKIFGQEHDRISKGVYDKEEQ
jgi:hypothetical protein